MPKALVLVTATTCLVASAAFLAGAWPDLFAVWLQAVAWLVAGVLLWRGRKYLRWPIVALLLVGWAGGFEAGTRVGAVALKGRFLSCGDRLSAFVAAAEGQLGRTVRPDVACFPVRSVQGLKTVQGVVAVVVQPGYPTRDVWVHASDLPGNRFGNRCVERVAQDWYRAFPCPGQNP